MLIACVRSAFLFATLVASLHVAAEPRYWTLNGVQFEDGAVATGYISYDDATQAVVNWNVRVSGGASAFLPWTFVPGNSHVRGLFSVYLDRASDYFWRDLDLAPVAPLDGRSTTVPIDVCHDCPGPRPGLGFSRDAFVDYYREAYSRKIIAGSFVLAPVEPPVTVVQVDEFYHPGLDRYFLTADAAEKHLLDTGVYTGWQRTNESFRAYATGSSVNGSINPACRYYGLPERGLESHFYSADLQECVAVFMKFSVAWLLESDNVFQINLPNTQTGACPIGTIPVYRLLNQRGGTSHRYTTNVAIKAQMIASGYVAEGYGLDGAVMCALQ